MGEHNLTLGGKHFGLFKNLFQNLAQPLAAVGTGSLIKCDLPCFFFYLFLNSSFFLS